MATITFNKGKNGIEIRFEKKPEQAIIDTLKENGFRWSKYQKMWYAKNNESRTELVKTLFAEGETVELEKVNRDLSEFNLWERTRKDFIENHYEKERLHDTKEIAKRIRTHLRERFPICKWSVRSDYNSIDVYLKSSAWDKDSEMVKAIMDYTKAYYDSYNYNNSDYMSDYFDVNFYGSCNVAWDYEQREETVKDVHIREQFEIKVEEAKIAAQIEWEKELERMAVEREENARKREEAEKIRKANYAKVMEGIEVKDVDEYFILNLKERDSKCCSVDAYFTDYEGDTAEETERNKWSRCDCKVSREVYMSENAYELFSNMLLEDWDFLAQMGGYDTDDNRINDMSDYNAMSESERKTVKWYNVKCVAIFVGEELKMVIDPEGFDYARYCFFPDEETVSHGTYLCNQAVSDAEKNANKDMAEIIEDASAGILIKNGLEKTWNNTDSKKYKRLMIEWIDSRDDVDFNEDVVREISIDNLKAVMYELLKEYNGMQEQFRRANIAENRKITMFKLGDLGGLTPQHMTFKSFEPTRYAQYDDAVKLIFRPVNKRKDYYTYLYNDVIIFDGFVDIPEDMFWIIESGTYGTTRRSKYTMFDHKMYDDVLKYFADKGITPIIDTFSPCR